MYGRIFTPFAIGGFTIVPEDHPVDPAAGLPLIMGKKGAFGSGEHETTASCLEEMERIPGIAGMRCLDLGSGTGILAVAAIRLGAASVVAVDIDPKAAESCAANVRLNGMEGRIFSVCGELASVGREPYDLLLANIYADIHLALAHEMVGLVRPGGWLILSGIPLQDKFDIQRRFRNLGCIEHDWQILEEYVTIVLRKPDAERDEMIDGKAASSL
ncbi:50S ribosomal protein L11 methyltransferase [Geobacter grbiciae]|uniref:50S ribosomal protein L11 methyltransferase n=1 Tax=Geobacter grbiciae TaxID=155042 RepID=UPI001C01B33C|nr:50S ribosomal protein L11 methyltransferase [Geobacter grbiciae]MBT1073733.1 50S ribosomal protein L11 methyltransferase [Geobacter grbiciae]